MADIIEPTQFDKYPNKHIFEFHNGATVTMNGKNNSPLNLSDALLMLDDIREYIRDNWRTQPWLINE